MYRRILLIAALVLLPACKDDPTNPVPDDETPVGRVVIYDTGSTSGSFTRTDGAASAGDGQCSDWLTENFFEFDPIMVDYDFECSATDNQQVFHSASTSGSATATFDIDRSSLVLTGLHINASAAGQSTPTGLASCRFQMEQRIFFRVEDAPVPMRALGTMVSTDATNDEFRLSLAEDFNTHLYRLRGRDGATLALDESLTLEPGKYYLVMVFTVMGASTGSVDYQVTFGK